MDSQNNFIHNISEKKGFFFGFILSISQIKIVYGLPFILLFLLFFSNRIKLSNKNISLFYVLIFQIFWLTFVYLLFPGNLSHYIKNVNIFIIILLVIISKFDSQFLIGFSKSLIVLFLIDTFFNLCSFFLGVDPLGRQPLIRPDDITERLGGVFGHSFFSLNISFIGIIIGCIRKNRLIFFLAILNIILIGILRGFILLLLILVAFVVIKKGVSFIKLKLVSLFFAASVFLITFYSVTLNFSQSNLMRVYAWILSLNNIIDFPIFGKHDFVYDDKFDSISFETIDNFGITESQYLELAVHYGLVSLFGLLFVLLKLFKDSYINFNLSTSDNHIKKITLIAIFVLFTDLFYGSIFGSTLTTVFFAILIFSDKLDFQVNNYA